MVNKLYTQSATKAKGKPTPRAILLRYKRRWPWFLLSLLVALAVPFLYLLFQKPVYKVRASLLIKSKKNAGELTESVLYKTDGAAAHHSIGDEIGVLTSYTLMDRVVKKTGLDVQYYYATDGIQNEIYAASPIRFVVEKATPELYTDKLELTFPGNQVVSMNGVTYPTNQSVATPYGQLRVVTRKSAASITQPLVVKVIPYRTAVNTYLSKLKVEPVMEHSGMVEISLVEAVPDKGEAILNQLIEEYKRESNFQKKKEAHTMLGFVEERLVWLAQELSEEKDSLLGTVENQGGSKPAIAHSRRMEKMIRTIPKKGKALLSVLREQKKELYTYLLQKREELVLAAASTTLDSRVVDVAHADEMPAEPVSKAVFLLFGLTGLLLPVALIRVKDALNDRVTRRTDIEGFTQAPILGEMVESRQIGTDNLVFKPHMQSVIGEQIRALRTRLLFLKGGSQKKQVILFTSSISGEGKSLISLNLGASLAMVNRPTVILEMDLRRPKLHKSLRLENGVGITDYLAGKASIDELIQPIAGYDNYFIATAGPMPLNPAELLSSGRLGQFFYELKERFDYIVVDSPPVGLVTDAQLIAPFADTTLFVVRNNYTPKDCLRMVETLYTEQQFKNFNLILNAVGEGEVIYYNDYYGDYETDVFNPNPSHQQK